MAPHDPREIFIRGESIVLRALRRQDAEDGPWFGWFNDETLCKTLQKHYFPNTPEAQVSFWERHVNGASDRIQLGICRPDDRTLIGVVSLSAIDYINRKAELSIVLGEPGAHNVKTFVEACRLMMRHGFDTLNLNRIYGGSMSREVVQMLCRTLRCRAEGVARQDIYKDGSYRDAYLYGVLREEFTAT